jgi:hypothetical protein
MVMRVNDPPVANDPVYPDIMGLTADLVHKLKIEAEGHQAP